MLAESQARAPFPWFGSKKDVAAEIWDRLGDVPNFVDPCCGSCAVPLLRPHPARTMTLNDADGFLVNFFRAVDIDPDTVAHAADWPVSECDLLARHAYLVKRLPWLVERLEGDPGWHDARLAGWWLWGLCAWIGGGWCSGTGPWAEVGGRVVNILDRGIPGPHLGSAGRGINRQLPHLGSAGQGINRKLKQGERFDAIRATLAAVQAQIRGARLTCGDWRRVLTPVVTWRHGLTGILLDPPYLTGEMSYAGGGAIAEEVGAWALEHGDNPLLRIVLCGHDGDYDLPGWSVYHWKARGGYGNTGGEDAEDNRHRETIWFSPHCLSGQQGQLW
jgi:DNA adenine methylase